MSSEGPSTSGGSSGAGTLSGHEGWGGIVLGAPAIEQSDSRDSESTDRSRRVGSKVRAKSHELKRIESARRRGMSLPPRDPSSRGNPGLGARSALPAPPTNRVGHPLQQSPSPDAEQMLAKFLASPMMVPTSSLLPSSSSATAAKQWENLLFLEDDDEDISDITIDDGHKTGSRVGGQPSGSGGPSSSAGGRPPLPPPPGAPNGAGGEVQIGRPLPINVSLLDEMDTGDGPDMTYHYEQNHITIDARNQQSLQMAYIGVDPNEHAQVAALASAAVVEAQHQATLAQYGAAAARAAEDTAAADRANLMRQATAAHEAAMADLRAQHDARVASLTAEARDAVRQKNEEAARWPSHSPS